MSQLDALRLEIEETYEHGIPTAGVVRKFKAKLWPVIAGWDYVMDDASEHEKELCRLIQLGIEQKDDEGDDPEKKLGALIVQMALNRTVGEFNDIIDEIQEKKLAIEDEPFAWANDWQEAS